MPKIRARYQVKPLGKVKRVVTVAKMNELKAMETTQETIEEEMFMVYFPQGHSTRMNKKELIENKLHLKPRMVDMETGDVIDTGGDPYDFDNITEVDQLIDDPDDDLDIRPSRGSKSKIEA